MASYEGARAEVARRCGVDSVHLSRALLEADELPGDWQGRTIVHVADREFSLAEWLERGELMREPFSVQALQGLLPEREFTNAPD